MDDELRNEIINLLSQFKKEDDWVIIGRFNGSREVMDAAIISGFVKETTNKTTSKTFLCHWQLLPKGRKFLISGIQ